MSIGEVIREQRKKLSLTQSELAERLGVSTQAVSKWETGAGMPDVSQIVLLARELHISTDRLFNYNDRYKELNKEWQYACFKYESGKESIYRLIEIDEQALFEYPDDETFLYRRVVDKYRAACDEQDQQKKADLLLDAEGNAMWALSKYPDNDSITSFLVRIYTAKGDRDRALEYAYRSKNKDTLLKGVLTGDELRRHRQRLIEKKLQALLLELQCGDVELLKVEEDIIRVIIPDGNFVWLYDYLMMARVKRAELYIRAGEHSRAVTMLTEALSLAKEKDGRGERRFTAPVFDMLDAEREDVPLLTGQFYAVCSKNRKFMPISDSEEYKRLLSDAAEFCRLHGETGIL